MTKYELAEWMHGLQLAVLDCDPSTDEDSLLTFCELQSEQDELLASIKEAGFTFEEIEELALF